MMRDPAGMRPHEIVAAIQERADQAELARVRKIVTRLRRDGMTPIEIVAAFHGKRRMRESAFDDSSGPRPKAMLLGRLPLLSPLDALRAEALDGYTGPFSMEVRRGDGDE